MTVGARIALGHLFAWDVVLGVAVPHSLAATKLHLCLPQSCIEMTARHLLGLGNVLLVAPFVALLWHSRCLLSRSPSRVLGIVVPALPNEETHFGGGLIHG